MVFLGQPNDRWVALRGASPVSISPPPNRPYKRFGSREEIRCSTHDAAWV